MQMRYCEIITELALKAMMMFISNLSGPVAACPPEVSMAMGTKSKTCMPVFSASSIHAQKHG